jgi:hypothetical protein
MGIFDSISDFFTHDVAGVFTSGYDHIKDGFSSVADFGIGAVKSVATTAYNVGAKVLNKADKVSDKLIGVAGSSLDNFTRLSSTLTNPFIIGIALIGAIIIVPPLLRTVK